MAGLFDEEILGAKEQALTARKLREAGTKSPEGQMVSGHFVAPSITQYLAEALKGYGLKRGEDLANEKYDTLRADRTAKISELLKNFPQASTSYPNATIGNDGPTIEALGQPVTKEPTEQDYINWGVNASAVSPEIGALGTKLAEYSMSRKDKQAEAEARRQDKKDLLQWQATQAKQAREEQAAYRADNARLIASLRPAPQEPLVAIMGPNGPVMVPRSQAIGATPFNPLAAKTEQQKTTAEGGKKTVSEILAGLRDSYNVLDEAGAITNPQKGLAHNLAAWAGSSVGGQAAGKMVGTKNQSVRNAIEMTRPLLLQAIMKATGMTAKQMDSNTELKLYLQTATDPTKDIAANKAALDKLERLYGLNLGGEDEATKTPGLPAYPMPAKPTSGSVKFLGFE